MGTLDEDMAQDWLMRRAFEIDQLKQKNEELVKKYVNKEQQLKEASEKTNQLKEELSRVTEDVNQLKVRKMRLDSLRPRTSPKKYKF